MGLIGIGEAEVAIDDDGVLDEPWIIRADPNSAGATEAMAYDGGWTES